MCSPLHLMWMLFFPEEKEHIICKTIYLAPSHPTYHNRECRDKSLSPTHVRIHTHTHTTFPTRKEKKRKHAPGTGSEQLSKHAREDSLTRLTVAVKRGLHFLVLLCACVSSSFKCFFTTSVTHPEMGIEEKVL